MLADNIDFIHLEVGGLRFSLLLEDIAKHPECLFATLAKREWRQNQEEVVKIDRDGTLFRYVYAFLISGYVPKYKLSVSELESLCEEADYFNLPGLAQACDLFEVNGNITDHIEAYKVVQKYCSDNMNDSESVTIDYENYDSNILKEVDRIPNPNSVYLNQKETSFCILGELSSTIRYKEKLQIYKSSNFKMLNIEELVADATPSPIGNSLEIPASALNQDTLEEMSEQLAPRIHWSKEQKHLQLRPYMLVIYQEGGHFEAHRDTVRGEGHIGTLVVILNSAYTGGELEIANRGSVKSLSGPYQWAAMYGDCFHRILPVTSGTRVSLLFDIYLAPGGCLRPSTDISTLRTEQAQLVAAVQAELESHEAVSICLEHMYPAAQAVPAFLKGRDGVLFALLQESFTMEVVHAVVKVHTQDYLDRDVEDINELQKIRVWFIRSFLHYSHASPYNQLNIKFVIPGTLETKTLLQKSTTETSYNCQEEDSVYCVTTLLISREIH